MENSFIKALENRYTPDPVTGCWLWHGPLTDRGYGRVRFGRLRDGRGHRAHVAVYEYFVGKVPDGLELDHKCRIRNCVNPKHLEPVTHKENIRRSRVRP